MSRRTRVALVIGGPLVIGVALLTAITVIVPRRTLERRVQEREMAEGITLDSGAS